MAPAVQLLVVLVCWGRGIYGRTPLTGHSSKFGKQVHLHVNDHKFQRRKAILNLIPRKGLSNIACMATHWEAGHNTNICNAHCNTDTIVNPHWDHGQIRTQQGCESFLVFSSYRFPKCRISKRPFGSSGLTDERLSMPRIRCAFNLVVQSIQTFLSLQSTFQLVAKQ